jgi:hypothetical protein
MDSRVAQTNVKRADHNNRGSLDSSSDALSNEFIHVLTPRGAFASTPKFQHVKAEILLPHLNAET